MSIVGPSKHRANQPENPNKLKSFETSVKGSCLVSWHEGGATHEHACTAQVEVLMLRVLVAAVSLDNKRIRDTER